MTAQYSFLYHRNSLEKLSAMEDIAFYSKGQIVKPHPHVYLPRNMKVYVELNQTMSKLDFVFQRSKRGTKGAYYSPVNYKQNCFIGFSFINIHVILETKAVLSPLASVHMFNFMYQ